MTANLASSCEQLEGGGHDTSGTATVLTEGVVLPSYCGVFESIRTEG